MLLRPFNFYLTWSMYGNLAMMFLCAWVFLGFIGFGIMQGSRCYVKERLDIKTKMIFIALSMLFGPIFLYRHIRAWGINSLKFW